MPADTLLNVNAPEKAATGYTVTRQGRRRYGAAIIEKTDPRGRKYYWVGGDELGFHNEEGTDFAAIDEGLISMTPLQLDLTNYETTETLKAVPVSWP